MLRSTFGCKVHDCIHLVVTDRRFHRVAITDVTLHKGIAIGIFLCHILHIFKPPGIGQLVVDNNAIVAVLLQHQSHKIAADKACTTGNKNIIH